MPFINSVFLSATLEDLESERQAAIETFVDLGIMPVSMEFFSDNGQDKREVIRKLICEADYYALVIGGKYGKYLNDEEKISFTEWEYNIAKQYGKKILAFIPADLKKIPDEKTDQGELKAEKEIRLKKFIEKVKEIPLVATYAYGNLPELKQKIQRSFHQYGYRDKPLSRYCGTWISDIKKISCANVTHASKSDEWLFYGRDNYVYGTIKRLKPKTKKNYRTWSFVGMEFGDQLILSFAEDDRAKMSAGIVIVQKDQGVDEQMSGYYYEFSKIAPDGKPFPVPIILKRKSLDWNTK